jgi:hypothetical protein
MLFGSSHPSTARAPAARRARVRATAARSGSPSSACTGPNEHRQRTTSAASMPWSTTSGTRACGSTPPSRPRSWHCAPPLARGCRSSSRSSPGRSAAADGALPRPPPRAGVERLEVTQRSTGSSLIPVHLGAVRGLGAPLLLARSDCAGTQHQTIAARRKGASTTRGSRARGHASCASIRGRRRPRKCVWDVRYSRAACAIRSAASSAVSVSVLMTRS